MERLLGAFKYLFRELGPEDPLINMYLVFMGIRSACLIKDLNIFYSIPEEANLEIHYGRYPGISRSRYDYPLVCLKNSWVSRHIRANPGEFSEEQLGLYLGFNCFDQDWSNVHIKRHEIKYFLEGHNPFYVEVCSSEPKSDMRIRIKFKAKEMNAALKMINNRFKVRYEINIISPIRRSPKKRRSRSVKINI